MGAAPTASGPDASTVQRQDAPEALGDFRIQREIGRGGMGVVYEARQISLGRKVALKVLPFAAMLDQRQLARFQNKARAAASLDHPNIVSVHSVGCERGVHYYAMRYIEGQTLADLVEELRRTSGVTPKQAAEEPPSSISQITRRLCSGTLDPDGKASAPAPDSPSADTKREVQARISTDASHKSPEYFRSVAQLGVQAAGALEHAHQTGVVHRDIKPSNLMVDDQGLTLAAVAVVCLALIVAGSWKLQRDRQLREITISVRESLASVQAMIEAGDDARARTYLAEARGRLANVRDSLPALARRVDGLLADIDSRMTALQRYNRFQKLADGFHGLSLASRGNS